LLVPPHCGGVGRQAVHPPAPEAEGAARAGGAAARCAVQPVPDRSAMNVQLTRWQTLKFWFLFTVGKLADYGFRFLCFITCTRGWVLARTEALLPHPKEPHDTILRWFRRRLTGTGFTDKEVRELKELMYGLPLNTKGRRLLNQDQLWRDTDN